MSLTKAQDLLRLAQIAAARRSGVSLTEIAREFGVSHRTAQRMTHALEATFADVVSDDDADLRRRWRIEAPRHHMRLRPRQETALEALEIAARRARDEGRLCMCRWRFTRNLARRASTASCKASCSASSGWRNRRCGPWVTARLTSQA